MLQKWPLGTCSKFKLACLELGKSVSHGPAKTVKNVLKTARFQGSTKMAEKVEFGKS